MRTEQEIRAKIKELKEELEEANKIFKNLKNREPKFSDVDYVTPSIMNPPLIKVLEWVLEE